MSNKYLFTFPTKHCLYFAVFCWLTAWQESYTQNLPAIRAEGEKYALLDTKNGTYLTPYKYPVRLSVYNHL